MAYASRILNESCHFWAKFFKIITPVPGFRQRQAEADRAVRPVRQEERSRHQRQDRRRQPIHGRRHGFR
jgi:hypothetical protein